MLFLGLLFIIAYDNKFTLTIAFQIEKVKSQLSGRGGINGTRPIRSGRSMLSLILRGVQAFQIWKQNFDPWVGVMAWTCTNNFRVVLGPCAQYCPSEASEQRMGQKPKT